jgi:hypothetical protein
VRKRKQKGRGRLAGHARIAGHRRGAGRRRSSSQPPVSEQNRGREQSRMGARVSDRFGGVEAVLTPPIVPLNRRIGIRRPGARGERQRRYRRALGHLGLGRKRVRQPLTAALGAKRAKQAVGCVRPRAKNSFFCFFFTDYSFYCFCSVF